MNRLLFPRSKSESQRSLPPGLSRVASVGRKAEGIAVDLFFAPRGQTPSRPIKPGELAGGTGGIVEQVAPGGGGNRTHAGYPAVENRAGNRTSFATKFQRARVKLLCEQRAVTQPQEVISSISPGCEDGRAFRPEQKNSLGWLGKRRHINA